MYFYTFSVTSCMIHGPCGPRNPDSPCMKGRKCTKQFPKEFQSHTMSDGDGYPKYRRRSPEDGGYDAMVMRGHKEYHIDNSWVVPYNPLLSQICNGHVNVEIAGSVKCVKYILKYINKVLHCFYTQVIFAIKIMLGFHKAQYRL